jgi:hypothetical protein
MAPGSAGNSAPQGQFGPWDVYPLFVTETARISDRRQIANTLYLSVNSLLVGAIAFLAQQSIQAPHLQVSVSLLLVQAFLAIAGLLITRQWYRTLELYRRLLAFRYEKLRKIENMPGFPGVFKMYQVEDDEGGDKKIFGFAKIEEFIPRLFRVLYVVSVALLVIGVIAIRIHFAAWLGQYIGVPLLK